MNSDYDCILLACGCNITGSSDRICNKTNGQCKCLTHVRGKVCDVCRVRGSVVNTKHTKGFSSDPS